MDNKDTSKNNGGVNPATALVTGAIVGAGVAMASAAVLKDKKNREKIKEVLTKARDQAGEYVNELRKTMEEKEGLVKDSITAGNKEVKRIKSKAKKIMDKVK